MKELLNEGIKELRSEGINELTNERFILVIVNSLNTNSLIH